MKESKHFSFTAHEIWSILWRYLVDKGELSKEFKGPGKLRAVGEDYTIEVTYSKEK